MSEIGSERGAMTESNELQKLIDRAYKDPIASILLKNSHITGIVKQGVFQASFVKVRFT